MFKKQKNKGNMLIIVLSTMFLLVTMGITFLSMSGLETKTVSTLNVNLKAKLAAEAGIDYAVTQLQNIFNQSIDGVGTSAWWFSKTSTKDKNGVTAINCSEEYDNASPYTLLASLHKSDDKESNNNPTLSYYPSFIMSLEDQPENLPYSNISGILGESNLTTISESNEEKAVFNPMTQYPFTLKVVDTTSQFPINTHATYQQILDSLSSTFTNNDSVTSNNDESSNITDTSSVKIVGKMLNRLSKEIAKMSWYNNKEGNRATEGPLQGLGENIITKRNNQGGFYSKYDIAGTYGDLTITLEDVADIWNYITVYPTWKQMGESAIYRNIAPYSNSNASYRIEYRCPVNINTASFPVLMAVLDGISTDSTTNSTTDSNKTILYNEAFYIAKNIIDIRKNQECFKSWTALKKFFDILKYDLKENSTSSLSSFYSNFDDKINLLMANFDPNVHLKESNPDKAVYQPITKIELTSYTTEFCFFPLGQFDITSLGEAFDYEGNVVSSSQTSTVIKIYETIYHTSQYDFECGPKEANQLLNPNNSNSSSCVVYQSGILSDRTSTYQSAKSYSGVGKGYNAFSSGNNLLKDEYSSINDIWKASSKCFGYIIPLGMQLITGSKNLDNTANNYFCQNFSSSNLSLLTTDLNKIGYPNPNFDTGIFNPNQTEEQLGYLYADGFYFRPGMVSFCSSIDSSNFPPLNDSINHAATVMFWFKINNTWDDSNKNYTVFFSDQIGTLNTIQVGIQHEIKFKVEKTNSLTRKLTITITNSLYPIGSVADDTETSKENFINNWNLICDTYKIFTQKVIELDPNDYRGIHAQEWYHLAVRWHNGLKLTSFSDDTTSSNAALAICGNFYDNSDGVLCSSENSSESIAKILDTDIFTNYQTNKQILITDIKQAEDLDSLKLSNYNDINILRTKFNEIKEIITNKLPRKVCTNQNKFYLGTVTEDATNNDVPNMTMDDFRISKAYLKTIDANDETHGIYQPSRYPSNDESITVNNVAIPCYSVFQGKMLGEANGTVTSLSWTSKETEALRPGYSSNVISQIKTVRREQGGITTTKQESIYQKLFTKFLSGNLKYESDKAREFINKGQTYENFKAKNWTAKLELIDKKTIGKLTGIIWSHTTEKNLKLTSNDIKIKKEFGNNLEEYDKNALDHNIDNGKYEQKEKSSGFLKSCKDITITYKEEIAKNSPIEKILESLAEKYGVNIQETEVVHIITDKDKATQEFIKESEEVVSSTPLKADNTPYVFDDENKSFIYELVFPAHHSGAIFNGPVIDDVTLIYLLKDPEFLEHSSDLLQH